MGRGVNFGPFRKAPLSSLSYSAPMYIRSPLEMEEMYGYLNQEELDKISDSMVYNASKIKELHG